MTMTQISPRPRNIGMLPREQHMGTEKGKRRQQPAAIIKNHNPTTTQTNMLLVQVG